MAYMEKKEVGMTKFWQIGMRDQWVTTRYGSLGGEGVSRTREFEDQQSAIQHLVQAVLSKKELGYELKNKKRKLEDMKESGKTVKKEQNTDKNEKTTKPEVPPRSPPNNNYRRKKRGLSGAAAPDTSKPLGFVDPESCLYGDLYKNRQGEIFDAMLVKQYDTSDCYYILQLIENKQYNQYKIYFRWGRTGAAGQCQVLHPQDLKEAVEMFEEKFWDKTGCEWDQRATSRYRSDLYRWVKPSATNIQVQKKQEAAKVQDGQQSSTQDNDGDVIAEKEAQGATSIKS